MCVCFKGRIDLGCDFKSSRTCRYTWKIKTVQSIYWTVVRHWQHCLRKSNLAPMHRAIKIENVCTGLHVAQWTNYKFPKFISSLVSYACVLEKKPVVKCIPIKHNDTHINFGGL